jgi:hypothetical protein
LSTILGAGFLAGAIRSGINIFLLLFRVLRAPKSLYFYFCDSFIWTDDDFRTFRVKMVLHAIFGSDTFRFSAMLASFTFIYKFLLNSLPLMPIPDQLSVLRTYRSTRKHRAFDEENFVSPTAAESPGSATPLTIPSKREKQGGKSGHLSVNSELVYSRLDGARWHAIVAGAVAGLSVLWETKGRRITIAQQIFVR